jgi:Transcriptional regulator SbtR-like, C-terminal domain
VTEIKYELMAVFGELLTRAQGAGAIRPDVGVADLGALVLGCLAMERQAHGGTESGAETPAVRPPGRLVAVVCDGLRTGPSE